VEHFQLTLKKEYFFFKVKGFHSDLLICITLDIIIEGAVLVSIFIQEFEGVMIAKVFKLDQCCLAIPVNKLLS